MNMVARFRRTRAEWATQINLGWRRTIECIVAVGADLVQAQLDLEHGEYMAMVAEDLPFGQDTAERLQRIASHARITDSAIWRNLPGSFRTLSELARLPYETFDRWMEQGWIKADMRYQDAVAAVSLEKNKAKRGSKGDRIPDEAAEHLNRYFRAIGKHSRGALKGQWDTINARFVQLLTPEDELIERVFNPDAVNIYREAAE